MRKKKEKKDHTSPIQIYAHTLVYITKYELTEIAAGNPTSGSTKNLFARARPRRLLCIPDRLKYR